MTNLFFNSADVHSCNKMFFLIVVQTNVAMCNRSMSLGFPPSHLWTFLTLGVETRIEPWDFPPTARTYCGDSVSSLRSFYTLIFSLRTHKDIFCFTDFYFKPSDPAFESLGCLILSWMPCDLRRFLALPRTPLCLI